MFKSYLLLALRNLWKNRGYAAINIFGLAIGLASSILIMVYVVNELTYDTFHNNSDRIYKVWISGKLSTGELRDAITAGPMAEALIRDYPEVENAVRIRQSGGWLVRNGDGYFMKVNGNLCLPIPPFLSCSVLNCLKVIPDPAWQNRAAWS